MTHPNSKVREVTEKVGIDEDVHRLSEVELGHYQEYVSIVED